MTSPTRQHRIRQRSPLVMAALAAATCALLLAAVISRWAESPQPLFAAWVVLALAVVWALFVRPAVTVDDDGVTFFNIVRDVHIPWQQVTFVESRWNLKVYVGDKCYTAWAISSQVSRPSMVGGMAGALIAGREGKTRENRRPPAAAKITAPAVAQAIEEAKEQYDAAARASHLTAPEMPVQVTWVGVTIAALAIPAIAVVVLSLT